MIDLVLYVLAFVCFAIAAFVGDRLGAPPRFNLIAIGLAAWVLTNIIP